MDARQMFSTPPGLGIISTCFSTYLLDTNAWVRLVQAPEELSKTALQEISRADKLAISPQSIIEVSQKWSTEPDFLNAPLEEWVGKALGRFISLFPIIPEIACDAYRLRDFAGDSADRVISAAARQDQITLITSDRRLLAHPEVKTLSTRR